jgi:hypothetical protein
VFEFAKFLQKPVDALRAQEKREAEKK